DADGGRRHDRDRWGDDRHDGCAARHGRCALAGVPARHRILGGRSSGCVFAGVFRRLRGCRVNPGDKPRDAYLAHPHGFSVSSGRCTRSLARVACREAHAYIRARRFKNALGPMTTIALVDDDRNILSSLSMALEAEGYHVKTYTDGQSALTALQAT